MTSTINKVICLKAKPDSNIQKNFEKNFLQTYKATQQLLNEIVCFGHDSVFSKDSVQTNPDGSTEFIAKDLTAERKRLYDCTDKSVTFEQFSDMTKGLYLGLVNAKQSRSMVSAIIGFPQSEEVLQKSDYKIVAALAEKWDDQVAKDNEIITKISNTLKSIGFRDREPYNILLAPGERYTVVANVHRMLTSWIECDTARSSTYDQEKTIINDAINSIDMKYRIHINDFFTECISNNWIKHFDPRIHAYLSDCVIPALKANKEITEHFICNRDSEHIPFSLHTGFSEYLKKNPILWQDDEPIILKNIHILEKIMSNKSHHPHAFYPFMSENDIHRFQYLLGDNYTKYGFEAIGKSVNDTSVDITSYGEVTTHQFINGVHADNLFMTFKRSKDDAEVMRLRIHTQDKRWNIQPHNGDFSLNPNSYFDDLTVWGISDKKCTNLLEFSRKGNKVRATVKEPSIVYNDGHYEVRMNMVVITDNDVEETEALKWYLSTALPASSTARSVVKDTPKNADRLKMIKGKTYKFLGVDLGQRTPYSYAVGESKITGMVNDLKILKTGEFASIYNEEYSNMLFEMKGYSKIIGITRGIAKGTSESSFADKGGAIYNVINKAKEYFRSHISKMNDDKKNTYQSFIDDKTPYDTLVSIVKSHNNDLVAVKKDYNFIGSIILKYLRLRFGAMKNDRKYHLSRESVSTKLNQEFKWLKIIEGMKRILRSASYLGTDNTRVPIELNTMTEYFNGVKDNFLKTIASSMVDIAVQNGCKIIVLENLDNQNVVLNKRNENFLHSLWSPKRVQAAIENAANWHGILIATVSESQTSQVHFESGVFGYRHGTSLYYYDNKNKLQTTHADMNAAKNIILKFVTRHASTRQANLGIFSEKDDAEKGKQRKGFLSYTFGTVKKAKEFFDKKFQGVDFAYLHGDTWISKEDKKKIQEDIKVIVDESLAKEKLMKKNSMNKS